MLRSRERDEILQEIRRTEAFFRNLNQGSQPEDLLNGGELVRSLESHFRRCVVP